MKVVYYYFSFLYIQNILRNVESAFYTNCEGLCVGARRHQIYWLAYFVTKYCSEIKKSVVSL